MCGCSVYVWCVGVVCMCGASVVCMCGVSVVCIVCGWGVYGGRGCVVIDVA